MFFFFPCNKDLKDDSLCFRRGTRKPWQTLTWFEEEHGSLLKMPKSLVRIGEMTELKYNI